MGHRVFSRNMKHIKYINIMVLACTLGWAGCSETAEKKTAQTQAKAPAHHAPEIQTKTSVEPSCRCSLEKRSMNIEAFKGRRFATLSAVDPANYFLIHIDPLEGRFTQGPGVQEPLRESPLPVQDFDIETAKDCDAGLYQFTYTATTRQNVQVCGSGPSASCSIDPYQHTLIYTPMLQQFVLDPANMVCPWTESTALEWNLYLLHEDGTFVDADPSPRSGKMKIDHEKRIVTLTFESQVEDLPEIQIKNFDPTTPIWINQKDEQIKLFLTNYSSNQNEITHVAGTLLFMDTAWYIVAVPDLTLVPSE